MKYEEWLTNFIENKKEVAAFDQMITHAVHSIHRYIDNDNQFWESAFTYTGRLVTRTGILAADGISITWASWVTQHEVEVSKRS